jgi:mannose-6-phosphate isomerase-like protein (cupin superfamily)
MSTIYEQFVVFKPDLLMEELPLTPDLYERLDTEFDGFKGHTLVSAYQFTESWPTWEIHPNGDEMVVLLSGSAEFKLKTGDSVASKLLASPGDFVIVPRNTWHTAAITESANLLFITPGEGTRNETEPTP